MSKEAFQELVQNVTSAIAGKSLDKALAAELNENFPAGSDAVKNIQSACEAAIDDGWMCDQEYGGIKFGRVIKDLDGFSVDVVHMKDVVGPHHRHRKGEIDLIMPIEGAAKFDNHGAGWVVYGPETAHRPTVTDGTAVVLYLLPDGEIEFTSQ
ncbi:MAG: DUF4863 family protein [Rhodospirillaceae bacterium]|nr:DUF4863 family protein [Rhodospirillaceae bacterium]